MALWKPTDAPGIHAWYSARNSADYTKPGSVVTAIADKAGLGHGASGRNGCGWSATGLDANNPAFTFDGNSAQSLDMNVSAQLMKVCYAVLVNFPQGYQTFFGCNQTDNFDFHIDGSNNICLDMFQDTNLVQFGGFTPNTPQLVLVTRDSAISADEIRLNGTSLGTNFYSHSFGSPDTHILGGVYNRDYAYGAMSDGVVLSDFDADTVQRLEASMLWNAGLQALLPAGHPYKSAAPTTGSSSLAYTLAAGVGAFADTGNDLNFARGLTLAAAAGAYAQTGPDAAFSRGYALSAGVGSFAQTGNDLAVAIGRRLQLDPAAFADTGIAAAFIYSAAHLSFTLACAPGSYVQTGYDAAQTAALAPGSFAQAGSNIVFTIGRVAGLAAGSFVQSEPDAVFSFAPRAPLNFTLSAAMGAFAQAGADLATPIARVMPLATGAFAQTGLDANLQNLGYVAQAYVLTCGTGSFSWLFRAKNLTTRHTLAGRRAMQMPRLAGR